MRRIMIIMIAIMMVLPLIAYGDLKINEPESGSVFGIQDIEVEWQNPNSSDYYLVTLEDHTNSNTVIYKDKVYGTYYRIDHSLLTDHHTYELKIACVKYGKETMLSTIFSINDDPNHLLKPELYNRDDIFVTAKKDVTFGWTPDYSSDHYLVSLYNISKNETLIENTKVTDNEFKVLQDKLVQLQEYKFKVTAVKGGISKSDEVSFFVSDQDLEQPRLIYPEDKSTFYRFNLRFLWTKIDTAQHYLVTIQNLTTGLKFIEKEKVTDNEYKILEEQLKEGHEYKISFASVIKGVEKWNEANFKIKEPELNYPEFNHIKSNEVIAYDSFKVSWEGTAFIDGYDVFLRDLTTEKIIYNERLDDFYTTFSKDLFSPDHSYELTVMTVRGGTNRTKKLKFSVEAADLSNFEFDYVKASYHKDMSSFSWTDVDGIDKYVVSVQSLNDKSFAVDHIETDYNSLKVPSDTLLEGREYRIVITAKSDLDEKTISHDFKTNGYDAISTWAEEYVNSVAANEVLKPTFFTSLYNTPKDRLTRAEFCEMLVSLYDTMESPVTVLDLTLAKSFEDIGDLPSETQAVVLKANALGIISGTSDTTFTPTGKVTRQEMAVMLLNTYKAMHSEMTSEWKDKFADVDDIASWAVEGVKFSNAMEILSGDGERFNPNDLATHEMGFVLLDKAMKNFDK